MIKSCTNSTVLAAFVWRERSTALMMKPDELTTLQFWVGAKSKLNPPMPKDFGNGVLLTAFALQEN